MFDDSTVAASYKLIVQLRLQDWQLKCRGGDGNQTNDALGLVDRWSVLVGEWESHDEAEQVPTPS